MSIVVGELKCSSEGISALGIDDFSNNRQTGIDLKFCLLVILYHFEYTLHFILNLEHF
jgi:hypothetical protein